MGHSKKTLVIGASLSPVRYSNLAIRYLLKHGHEVVALGRKPGMILDVSIETGFPVFNNIDTITVYLNQGNQAVYHDYLIGLKPKRIIFNQGAENPELKKKS